MCIRGSRIPTDDDPIKWVESTKRLSKIEREDWLEARRINGLICSEVQNRRTWCIQRRIQDTYVEDGVFKRIPIDPLLFKPRRMGLYFHY